MFCCCMNQIPGGTLCDDCTGPECQVVFADKTFSLNANQIFLHISLFLSVVIATVPVTVSYLNVTPLIVSVLKFN